MGQNNFTTLAAYNQWANERLYNVVDGLSEAQRNQDMKVFFGSLMATLNHILVGDLVWMARIEKAGRVPGSLDAILHTDFMTLLQDRQDTDVRIIKVMEAMPDQDLSKRMTYQNVAGKVCEDLTSEVLTHMFNHQTHHRGQCHAMLSQLGQEAPPLDLIYYIRHRDG